MGFLPIVERELRVAARNSLTYRGRIMTASVAIVGVLWLVATFNRTGMRGGVGRSMFASVEQILYIWCIVAGLTSTADSLSSEKREGTLGLLFLTPLRSLDIVVGKLAAGSIGTLCAFLSAVPALAITVLVGGITGAAFWLTVVALLNTLFVALSAGLLLSSCFRETRRFLGLFMMLGILSGNVLPAVMTALQSRGWGSWLVPLLNHFNPHHVVSAASTATTTGQYAFYWRALAANHLFGWAILAVTTWVLPRSWQDRPARVASTPFGSWLKTWRLGSPGYRADLRRKLLDSNPITWLLCRERFQEFGLWIAIGVTLALGAWLMSISPGSSVQGVVIAGFIVLTLNLLTKLRAMGDAAGRWAADRQSGALEMLLVVPLGVDDLVRGQVAGLRRRFAAPVVVSLAAQIFFCAWALVVSSEANVGPSRDEFGALAWGVVGGFVATASMLLVDVETLWRVGPWSAMKAKLRTKATNRAFFHVFSLPWLALLVTFTYVGGIGTGLGYWGFLLLWTVYGLAADGYAVWTARREMRRDFRILATARYQPHAPSWWEQTGQRFGLWWMRRWCKADLQAGRRGDPGLPPAPV